MCGASIGCPTVWLLRSAADPVHSGCKAPDDVGAQNVAGHIGTDRFSLTSVVEFMVWDLTISMPTGALRAVGVGWLV